MELCSFFFSDTATTEIYTLSLHDALPILHHLHAGRQFRRGIYPGRQWGQHLSLTGRLERSEEHTSELQSRRDLVCRLLLEKKNHHLVCLSPLVFVARLLASVAPVVAGAAV